MANRAGQIIPRGNRKWLVRVFLGREPETGKRNYHNKTIHGNKKDAQAYLNTKLRERDMGAFVEPAKTSLGQYLDRWLETAAKPRLREKTYRDYAGILNRYVRPTLGNRSLASLTPLDIQNLYKEMQDSDLSARTIRYTHAVLRSALQQAVKWRLHTLNPAEHVDLPRQKKTEMQVLTPEESRRFLDVCPEDRYGVLFALAITSGMRPSEYRALQWKDIDWKAGTVSVRRTLEVLKGGGWRFEDTKRPTSRRKIKLQSRILRMVEEHHQVQSEQRAEAGGTWTDHDLVFTSNTGEPVNERNLIQRHFKPILNKVGLPDIRLYDLRHTAATLALCAGVSAKVVSEQLGHASVAFTLDVYSHVLPHMQDAAAAMVEKLLRSMAPDFESDEPQND